MKHEKGFTLVELMITVVILAIIVSVALPSYGDYVTRSKIPEATSTLSSLRVSMEQYYQDNRTYLNGANCGVPMPTGANTKNFDFSCINPLPTQNTYTITATGKAGMAGFAYTVDQANTKTSAITAPATTSGWSNPNPNSCWVTNKGGAC